MKVLSEYPDAEKTSEQQNTALGETYLELGKRLDEGILSLLIIYDILFIIMCLYWLLPFVIP